MLIGRGGSGEGGPVRWGGHTQRRRQRHGGGNMAEEAGVVTYDDSDPVCTGLWKACGKRRGRVLGDSRKPNPNEALPLPTTRLSAPRTQLFASTRSLPLPCAAAMAKMGIKVPEKFVMKGRLLGEPPEVSGSPSCNCRNMTMFTRVSARKGYRLHREKLTSAQIVCDSSDPLPNRSVETTYALE